MKESMKESAEDKFVKALENHQNGIIQRHLAIEIGISPAYVRKISLEVERRGLCRIVETDRPVRKIVIYPVEKQGDKVGADEE